MPYFVAPGRAITSGRGVLECPEEVTPKCLVRGLPDKDQLAEAQKSLDTHVELGTLVKQPKAPELPKASANLQEADMRPHAPKVIEPEPAPPSKKGGDKKGGAQAAKT